MHFYAGLLKFQNLDVSGFQLSSFPIIIVFSSSISNFLSLRPRNYFIELVLGRFVGNVSERGMVAMVRRPDERTKRPPLCQLLPHRSRPLQPEEHYHQALSGRKICTGLSAAGSGHRSSPETRIPETTAATCCGST